MWNIDYLRLKVVVFKEGVSSPISCLGPAVMLCTHSECQCLYCQTRTAFFVSELQLHSSLSLLCSPIFLFYCSWGEVSASIFVCMQQLQCVVVTLTLEHIWTSTLSIFSSRFRENRHVSVGAEKWLDIELWDTTKECFDALKSRGYSIAATHVGTKAVRNSPHFGFLLLWFHISPLAVFSLGSNEISF